MKKMLFFSFLFTVCGVLAMQSHECEYRNIFIFLDQDGDNENISKPFFFLNNKLQAAISEEVAPILINVSLWNNFIERRLSVHQMSQLTNSPEEKALTVYKKIGMSFTHWFEYYKSKDINHLYAQQLALEKTNEEFYNYTKYDQEFITTELNRTLITYLTAFDKNNWDFYTNDGSFYLLVPKKYVQKLRDHNQFSEEEILLGLKINHLEKIVDIENPVVGYLNECKIKKRLPEVLDDFFITKENYPDSNYKWNILLSGHGAYRYLETTIKGKVEASGTPRIADLNPREFTYILNFFNNSIQTNCLYYTSCNAGGNHIKLIYDDNNNPSYNYTIICGCLSDGDANCLWQNIPFPSLKKTPLKLSDLVECKGKWNLKIDHVYQWSAFFYELEKNKFDNPNLHWLTQAFNFINNSSLSNSPIIRLPYQQSFAILLKNDFYTLNDQIIATKIQENSKEIITLNKVIIIDTSSVPLPLVIKNPAIILSTIAGNAYHYFHKIEFKNNNNFLELFYSLDGNPFDTYFIIDELIIKNYRNSLLSKESESTGKKIRMKNVLVHIKRESLTRIIGSINNKYYMINVYKAPWSNKFEGKGLFTMPEINSTAYLNQYNYLKNKALAHDL